MTVISRRRSRSGERSSVGSDGRPTDSPTGLKDHNNKEYHTKSISNSKSKPTESKTGSSNEERFNGVDCVTRNDVGQTQTDGHLSNLGHKISITSHATTTTTTDRGHDQRPQSGVRSGRVGEGKAKQVLSSLVVDGDLLTTVDYLTGPSIFDGLITPTDSEHPLSDYDRRRSTARSRSQSSHSSARPSGSIGRRRTDDLYSHHLLEQLLADQEQQPERRRRQRSEQGKKDQNKTRTKEDREQSTRRPTTILRAKSSAQLNAPLFGHDPLGFDSEHTRRMMISEHKNTEQDTTRSELQHQPSHFGSIESNLIFKSTPRGGPLPDHHNLRRRIRLFWLQFVSAIVSNILLISIALYGLSRRGLESLIRSAIRQIGLAGIAEGDQKDNKARAWDDVQRWADERVTMDYKYYAETCGYGIVDEVVETADGYYLPVWKVIGPEHQTNENGYPVLIQHGLFQSAGSFITSEERSLAFWLASHGYRVYLGNNRGIFDMGHRHLSRSDPRFWDFNIKELALYDLPALVDHVLKETGSEQLAFIGHSQGNATMFCSLARGMVPELGPKISCFIALAPAVYSGPLTNGFPFGLLKSMRWRTWRRVFGVLDFLPIMRLCVKYLPSSIFGFLGYQMFAFLFNWTDANWLMRRKLKMFRFTPQPTSSAAIFWWTGYQGFSTRGCVLDPQVERWWDERFPPLALYHGGSDFLVLAEPLVERIKEKEREVRLIRNYKLEGGEHCDHFWHIDAVELCFEQIKEDIESTRKGGKNYKPIEERIEVRVPQSNDEDIEDETEFEETDNEEVNEDHQDKDKEQKPILDLDRDV